MALHSNLRTPNWDFHEDDKHFYKSSIGKFASNLKRALRNAVGIVERTTKKTPKKTPVKPKSEETEVDQLKKRLIAVLQGK